MQAFIELLNKKKTIVALATVAGTLLAKYGFDLDQEILITIASLGALLVGSLALEDKGKAATKIEADAALKAAEIDLDIAEADARKAEALAETANATRGDARTETEA